MARRSASTAPESTTTAPTEESTVSESTTTDLPVEPTDAELDQAVLDVEGTEPEPTVEAESEPTTAEEVKPEAKPIDLTEFEAATTAALEHRDLDTGDLASTGEAGVAALKVVQEAYRALDGLKAKNAAKNQVQERMKAAMNALDISTARALMEVNENLTAAAVSSAAPKPPADPTAAAAERIASLQLAVVLSSDMLAEGVDAEAVNAKVAELTNGLDQAKVTAYGEWLASEAEDKGDAPEVPAFVRAAFKVSSGKATAGRKAGVGTGSSGGVRRNIGEHIKSAFAGVESGTFLTIADIQNHQSAEYGEDKPSAGAISARLFPASGTTTLDFVVPGKNDKSNRGATKK